MPWLITTPAIAATIKATAPRPNSAGTIRRASATLAASVNSSATTRDNVIQRIPASVAFRSSAREWPAGG